MSKKLLCYVVALSTALLSNAFTLKEGNIYFDNSKALFSNVTMLCQGNNSQTEVVPMSYDEETGLYKATLTPSFDQYTSIGFVNQELPDTIVDKKIKVYIEDLRTALKPQPEEPSVDDPSIDNPTTGDETPTGEAPSEGDVNQDDQTPNDDNSPEETTPTQDDNGLSDEDSNTESSADEQLSEEVNPGEGEQSGENENPSESDQPGENRNPGEGELPGEEPAEEVVFIGEISLKLPFLTDNVFVPYMSETADLCGNWTPLHPEQFTPSGNLPILYVDIKDGQDVECKAKNLDATFYFDAMGNENCVSIGSIEEPLPTKIKGRGNSTWRNIAKKPYKLKLDKAASFFGLPKHKHWALMAHAMGPLDWMCNASAFHLANDMDFGWHPSLYPIELVLNGEYQGVYFLCETIKVGEGRLEIFEQKDMETDPEIIPGGWLVEVDNYVEDVQVKIMEKDMALLVTPHSPENLSQEQFEWLESEFSYMTSSIHAPYKDDPMWMDCIDAYDMAKYFVIQEIFDNPDGFNGSFYLHKDQGVGQKWHAGPLWDISCYTREKTDWTFNMDAGYHFHAHWIKEMVKYQSFLSIVKEVFRSVEEKMPQLYQFNLEYAANVALGSDANNKRWPTYNTQNPIKLASWLNQYLQKNTLHFETKLSEAMETTAIEEIKAAANVGFNLNGNNVSIPSKEAVSIEVFDVTGRKIASANANEVTIPTSGVAIIKVTSEKETLIQKVLVK